MKIYLYLSAKILTFTIPSKVSGSFSFDEDSEEESKLINIEAKESKWFLYSTTDVGVIINGATTNNVELKTGTYYTLNRSNVEYLIYVTDIFDDTYLTYNYNQNINLIIGNTPECNIKYQCAYLKGVAAKIYFRDGRIVLDVSDNSVYLNDLILKNTNSSSYIIYSGDVLHIFGLSIVFLNGFLAINNPSERVIMDITSSFLTPYNLSVGDTPKEVNFKDQDLYNKFSYFNKSPRLRRQITTKEMTLSAAPKMQGEDEMPLILTVGPMFTMAIASVVTLANNLTKLASGTATIKTIWPQLLSSAAMLISMAVWPNLTKMFNKKLKERKQKELLEKYTAYLDSKRLELQEEIGIQKSILIENLIPVEECFNIINGGQLKFWDKRVEQNDFLEVRIGFGNELLDADINYPDEGFTVDEDELRKKADEMIEDFKYIPDVPIGYSLYENKTTAIMGRKEKFYGMIHNIILQLVTFYSYEDIKLVIFTNKLNEDNWEYARYLNHCFDNSKSIRFFSTDLEDSKYLCDYLGVELQRRISESSETTKFFKPYYIVISDDYSSIKRHSFIKMLTEIDANLGFSLIILEEQMSKLPSKCNNFIDLRDEESKILKNSFEDQEVVYFRDEINYNVDMMAIARRLSNIPIEFEEGMGQLPESLTFLEMEKVGKVEQLNIMNRWDSNDSTSSLKAEVGVDSDGNLMYLDLHEKFHGPHGLIAGTTGSGKSEFIITYILSMAINYSPDDVAFILIDYKGGGLALAFENKATGVSLPHLAGTITNLDKAEMDRTLVSIDSEVKRRQQLFNEARDTLGESTIDIYKYQRFFKEGKLKEPIPHLFIICDEFAELKSQQPDFMDNLISVARIGRSLGVHLILATQKPSGVVNDQIWSNTRFRVCLKVNDASDSKEMLKRPDAAAIKQTGRFYLQVGYDEYFALGQSGWCGAKYYPSDTIVKQADKSVNFINDIGNIIKSVKAGSNVKVEAQGEQIAAIMKNIIEVSKISNKKTKRLWLNDIDPIILVDNLEKKYNFEVVPYDVRAIIGEYDAPELQEQGLLTYSLREDGNTIIYSNEEAERESLLNSIVYSSCKNHSAKEINIYLLDYGSEQFRMFNDFPQIGGMVFVGDDEKFKNLFKLINDEIKRRKKLLVSYGGSFKAYNQKSDEKLPQILFIINNYEAVVENYSNIYEDISSIGRDCDRYGINIILTCNGPSAIGRKVGQCFNNRYALHLTDPSDYYAVFNTKVKTKPRDRFARGVCNNNGIHEFQTASIVENEQSINEFLNDMAKKLKELDDARALSIPHLPDNVTFDIVEKSISTLDKVPIGVSKSSLKVVKYDFTAYLSTIITANKLIYLNSFLESLIDVLLRIQGLNIFFIDTLKQLPSVSQKVYNDKKINYYDNNFDIIFEKLTEWQKNPNNKQYNVIYVIYGLEKLNSKVDSSKINNFIDEIKTSENSHIIFCDGSKALKSLDFEKWYSNVKNNTDGIWVGKGFGEQQLFRISKVTKEMTANYANNYGFSIVESDAELMKVLEFYKSLSEGDDDDDE